MKLVLRLVLVAACAYAVSPSTSPATEPRNAPDVERPIKWLVANQNPNGGWGADLASPPDVATTAISGLALVRMGHGYSSGAYRRASVQKAVEYVVAAVEHTPSKENAINAPGTLPQRKLGRYIDTFVGAQFLSEVLPSVPKGKVHDRVRDALDICVDKTQAAQRQDGSFSADGWAPVLSTAFASGGLYAARNAGSTHVRADVLDKGNQQLMHSYDTTSGQFKTGESAGVQLYPAAGAAGAAARSGNMNSPPAKAAMAKLADEQFLRGFGTYGGEEHVSFMMTSEALATVGGAEWEKWNKAILKRLALIQRADGTWRGDHCITSTAFCTAASLITMAIQPKAAAKPHA